MHLISNRIIILLSILSLSACGQASNFEDIKKSANRGDALSQALLGEAYVNGGGVSQDYKKAFEWYKKSAEQGNVDAQFTVGMMYHRGDGTAQNDEMAEIWLKQAAGNGHKDAIKYRP